MPLIMVPEHFTVSIETATIEVSGYGTNTCSFSSFSWYVDDVLLENQTGYSLRLLITIRLRWAQLLWLRG